MRGYLGNLKVTECADLPEMMEQRCCLTKRTGSGDNIGHTQVSAVGMTACKDLCHESEAPNTHTTNPQSLPKSLYNLNNPSENEKLTLLELIQRNINY